MTRRRLPQMAERAGRTAAAMQERPAREVAPERNLDRFVTREDEWLDPGLARRRAEAEARAAIGAALEEAPE